MLITLKTFDGHNINDGTSYRATLLNPHGTPDAAPVFLEQQDADSVDAGTYTVAVQQKVLKIQVLNYASRHSLIAQLKTWFKRGTDGTLVATFSDDGVDYQLSCRAVTLVQDERNGQYFTALLQTGDSTWRAVSETTESLWTVTGTSETQVMAVGGKDETYLSVDLVPTAGPSAGYLYQNIYRLVNTPGVEHGLIAICITVNTAALVTATKMQADCDDLRVFHLDTGAERRRWITGANTTTTKVWINLNLKKGFALTLGTTIASSGTVDYIQFSVTDAMKSYIAEMPATGVIYHGNEWFFYTGKDAALCRLTIGQRALFGTTMEGHTAGVTFNYIQYPLAIKYGNPSAVAPASLDPVYDDLKPLINLTSSSNTVWVWDATNKFFDPAHSGRTCGWRVSARYRNGDSKAYYIAQDAESGNSALGFKVVGYPGAEETAEFKAAFYRAAGIEDVTITGARYRTNANWPAVSSLRRGSDGLNFFALITETSPATGTTWTNFANNGLATAVAAGSKFLQLYFAGGYPIGASQYAMFEMLTCSVTFPSTYIPSGAFLGEEQNYPLVATVENLTTGDAIYLDFGMLLDKTFSIDGEDKTVLYDTYNAYEALRQDDESRPAFIRLQPGNNTIQISGADLGTVEATLRYYKRRL